MDTLDDQEVLQIWLEARAQVPADAPNRAEQVNKLVQQKSEHALRMKELRRRVDLEIQSNIW